MRNSNVYRDVVLTVIAGLMAWATFIKANPEAVHAQPQAAYAVERITLKWGWTQYEAELASAINNASKGRELIAVVKLDGRHYWAIYK